MAREERIIHEESKFDFSVLDSAISDRREVSIHDIIADDLTREAVEVVHETQQDDVIIDIRHPTEEEIKPFELTDREVMKVPFYQLRTQFHDLDKDKHYLLYCEKGVMSQLHAMHLIYEGHQNVGVYTPEPKQP